MKNLGVYMDRYLTFDTHINEISKKVTSTLLFINRAKNYFDRSTRHVIVHSLALSIINYCITIWGTTNKTLIKSAQKLQNFAAKIVDGRSRKYDHVSPILKELKWLNIQDTITFNIAASVYKLLNNQYPNYLITLPTVNNVTQSNTRQHNNLYVPKVRCDVAARALSVKGPKIWNRLPQNVRGANNIFSFKTKLKDSLLP